jgi:hypothetical protein
MSQPTKETKTEPTPWTIEIDGSYATVFDANKERHPELMDIELGWTDRTTGNYHSPEEAAGRLYEIVDAVNNHERLKAENEELKKKLDSRGYGDFAEKMYGTASLLEKNKRLVEAGKALVEKVRTDYVHIDTSQPHKEYWAMLKALAENEK